MSLPYTFANATGNIPLYELDANFTSVQAYVYTAGTVTSTAQPNITSVGTLNSLTISELTTTNDIDVTGQLTINWLDNSGNPQAGPGILASTANIYDLGQSSKPFRSGYFGNGLYSNGVVSATGNIVGAYILGNGSRLSGMSTNTYGNANVANYLPTFNGNLTAGNVVIAGNITGGNLIIAGTSKNTGLQIVGYNPIVITANSQPANLSNITSTNFILANNTGYTCIVNFPSNPVDGQVTTFAIVTNAVVLANGTGVVNSTYIGSANVGTGFKYIYTTTGNTWNKSP
jgi:hypothetical protein